MRRLVVVDFALALAALLAVVAIGDPGGGELRLGTTPFADRSFSDDGGEWSGSSRDPLRRSGTVEVVPGDPGQPGGSRSGELWIGGSATAPPSPAAPGPVMTERTDREPGPVRPVRDGRYRHRVTASSDDETHEDEATTTYATTSSGDRETRQSASGDGAGGFMSPNFSGGDHTLVWRSDGLWIEQPDDDGAVSGGCEPTEYLLIQFPLEAGATWNARSDCEFGFGEGFGGSTRTQSSSVVRGAAVVEVAGQRLVTWEIHSTTRFEGEFVNEGETDRFEGVVEAVQFFSPAHGLFVLGHGTYRGNDGTGEETGSFRAESLNLDPE